MKKLCLIRSPALPVYHDVDIKGDPMLCAFIGYLNSIQYTEINYSVFDFQLDKSIDYAALTKNKFDCYIIAARDVGESYRYSIRLANLLARDTKALIVLYGQVAPLRFMKNIDLSVKIVNQSEQELAETLGISTNGSKFNKNLRYLSYYDKINLEPWQRNRLKGVIETTRGCPYKCNFCFINAGDNYEKKWQVRPNDMIIEDLKAYTDLGIRKFVFLDSEFLGANPRYHQQKKELLHRMINEIGPIQYMALCRADTLLMFNQFELLKQSGLNKVLVGIESLYQPDLDYLRKDSTVEKMMVAIQKLIEHEIECCLTYLTFNKNTTAEGLRTNLKRIETLYQHPNARYLGMPNFSFNMEIVRQEEARDMKDMSDTTYILPLLQARGQVNTEQVCFPNHLEPLIEIYRLLQYEWVVKKCELVRYKNSASKETVFLINEWFSSLGLFCVRLMRHYLDLFENGLLTVTSIGSKYRDELFAFYQDFYQTLPEETRNLATYEHAKSLDYVNKVSIADHGWDHIIPNYDVELSDA
jgi:MoaA/NifB/PqqE/SkfB family radical SAM enzyme